MADWAALERDVFTVSQAVSWDWRRELEDLHRQLDELEERVRGH